MITQERVGNMIDKMITKSFKEGHAPSVVIQDLNKRSQNIFKIIEKQDLDMSSLFGVLMGDGDINDDSIPKKVKYAYFYVTHCNKRVKDLKWLMVNKRRNDFISSRRYTNSEILGLIQLKEKLLKTNDLPF